MSEDIKKDANTEDKGRNPLLPKVDYPELDIPKEPETGRPQEETHMSCEGEVYVPPQANPNVAEPLEGKPRILIGIPILTYSHEFVQSFIKFWTSICLKVEGKFQVGYQFIYRKPVHMAEDTLIDIARYNKCTHILFMDDDIYDVTIDDLEKLINADKEVIGGVMYASKFPFAMCVFRRYNTDLKVIDMPSDNAMYRLYEVPCSCSNPKCNMGLSHWDAKYCPACGTVQDNMIQKADLIPFCFTLMKISIFDKIKPPAFYCSNKYPSDSWFADKCIEAGIQMYAHMGVRLNHAGITDVTKPMHLEMGIAERRSKQDKGLVNISPDDMQKHEFMLYNKMKEAEIKVRDNPIIYDLDQVKLEGVKNDCKSPSIT